MVAGSDAPLGERVRQAGRPFVFLGYKGSGKTAIAERARLLAEDEPNLFVTTTSLEDLSYGEFSAVAGAAIAQAARSGTKRSCSGNSPKSSK